MKKILIGVVMFIILFIGQTTVNAYSSTRYLYANKCKIFLENKEKTLINLNPNQMKAKEILNDITTTWDKLTPKAYKKDGTLAKEDELLGTGSTIKAMYTKNNISYEIYYETIKLILYGDTNGDGRITSADALIIVKNKTGKIPFENECFKEAGRITATTRKTGAVPSSADALAIVKNKLGKINIEQSYQKLVTIDNYDELYIQLSQSNTNLKFANTDQGKQIEANYNKLKNVVNTYCKNDMSQANKALVLHDYLVSSSKLERLTINCQ